MESSCKDDSPECRCPCGCGCQNDPEGCCLPFYSGLIAGEAIKVGEDGICADCFAGKHEVPPSTIISHKELIARHESVLAQLKMIEERDKLFDIAVEPGYSENTGYPYYSTLQIDKDEEGSKCYLFIDKKTNAQVKVDVDALRSFLVSTSKVNL